jgi:hypothetical protein
VSVNSRFVPRWGAGRVRILRQLLVESLLLSVSGGLAGLILAVGAIHAILVTARENIPRLPDIHLESKERDINHTGAYATATSRAQPLHARRTAHGRPSRSQVLAMTSSF